MKDRLSNISRASVVQILAIFLVAAVAGCASAPEPFYLVTETDDYELINASKLSFLDYTTADSDYEHEFYVSGWHEWNGDGGAYIPRIEEAMFKRLQSGLRATGAGDSVRVVLLRSDMWTKRYISDDVVFVNLFRVGRDMEYRCDLELSIEFADKAERVLLQYDLPIEREENKGAIDECHTELVALVADEINSRLRRD